MSKFTDAKDTAKRKRITTAERAAKAKNLILHGFQCPQKRCMHVLTVAQYRDVGHDHPCHRCGSPVDTFTAVMVEHRRVTEA